MSKLAHEFSGVLQRRPFKNRATPAMAQVLPLTKVNDFERFVELNSFGSPVFVNFFEHYDMLSQLVEQAEKQWPDLFVLIRISMPGGMRIPKALLKANVLLLEDIEAEEQKLSQYNEDVLVIEDYFVHLDMEKGSNQLSCRLYTEKPAIDAFTQLCEQMMEWGIN